VIVLVVMTDGRRECITRAIPSLLANVQGPITYQVIHDDSGDPGYQDWLRAAFPAFEVIHTPRRSGFGGAYANAWRYLADLPQRFVFSVEDDFIYERPVDLLAMAEVLDWYPYLRQVALRRQAWNADERTAGGVVELHPGAYAARADGGNHWLEHRQFFTTNPSLFRTELCDHGWPPVEHSEGVFTHRLLEDPVARFAYWGERTDGPWVTHIGHQRAGVSY
jgi:hypothetical protein